MTTISIMPPRLRLTGISKSFGATQALRDVSLEVAPGEVHALVGENGAGKSTLMNILSGVLPPDAGGLELDGAPYAPRDTLDARRHGVAMIHQELSLAPHLSAWENIMLGAEPNRAGWLRRSEAKAQARAALAQLAHEHLELDRPAGKFPIAEQQIIEIARALRAEPRVLIMDEPTTRPRPSGRSTTSRSTSSRATSSGSSGATAPASRRSSRFSRASPRLRAAARASSGGSDRSSRSGRAFTRS